MRFNFGRFVFISILLFFISAVDCARFRIEELEPTIRVSLKLTTEEKNNPEQNIQIRTIDNVPYNFPLRPASDDSFVYLSDPVLRLVKVISASSGETTKIIGEAPQQLSKEITHIPVPNSIPGWITSNNDDSVYIQFFQQRTPPAPDPEPILSPEKRAPGVFNTRDKTLEPSWIYKIKGNRVELTIGQEGTPEIPFDLIYRMDAIQPDLLYVSHRLNNKKTLSIYKGGTLLSRFMQFDPGTQTEKQNYLIEIEEYAPQPANNFVIASVVYRDKKTYNPVYRKIFRLNSPEDNPENEIYKNDEPGDFFCWSRSDGGFYLMNVEEDGTRILFKIFNAQGEYLNNRLIRYPGLRSSWRDTYMTIQEKIFSSRIYRGYLELYEWK